MILIIRRRDSEANVSTDVAPENPSVLAMTTKTLEKLLEIKLYISDITASSFMYFIPDSVWDKEVHPQRLNKEKFDFTAVFPPAKKQEGSASEIQASIA